eukprot:CAMPEP_0198112980 /NCGR_PEP_ID=MMETSP1442-20131203/4750_1 /TAXON_ID= /ORGANISM="Craspedostauros australis, Strain CCMP3328" /LENGTH=251 /DNA_ID=CAMNT_0043769943 /DNA_START=246 /DNA_END=1001 /DNA_ORIENTATION=+
MTATGTATATATATTAAEQTTIQHRLPPFDATTTTRVFLLRHGETNWNKQGRVQGGGFDIPLNDNGKHQAQCLAKELHNIPMDVVASSKLQRASATADAVHQRQHDDAQRCILDGFNEMNFGDFEGKQLRGHVTEDPNLMQRYRAHADRMKEDPTIPFPGGGESFREVEQRARSALEGLVTSQQYSRVAVVAHGRTNKILLSSLLYENDYSVPLQQGNTCVNVLDYDHATGKFTPQIINYFEHVKDSVIIR